MIVVIDTNILISALIKDSLTRDILIGSGMDFVYPEISLHEIRKHERLIMEKSSLTKNNLDTLLARILDYVVLVPTEVIEEHLDEARKIMLDIDPKDVVFIAAALSFENPVIWSDDRDFDKQDRVRVVKTERLARLFGK